MPLYAIVLHDNLHYLCALMKYFPIILGFYLLALAIIPCADGTTMGVYDTDEPLTLEWSGTADHDHDHDATDYCSPLCSCSCCHITIRPPVKIGWQLDLPLLILTQTPIVQSDVRDFACLDDIWQPPKFS